MNLNKMNSGSVDRSVHGAARVYKQIRLMNLPLPQLVHELENGIKGTHEYCTDKSIHGAAGALKPTRLMNLPLPQLVHELERRMTEIHGAVGANTPIRLTNLLLP